MGKSIKVNKTDTLVTGEEEITMKVNSGNLKLINLINKKVLIRTNVHVKLIH